MDFPSLIEPLESRIAPATLSIANVSISEGNSGTKTATFTVSLDAPATEDVTVHYATSDGTALSTQDYTAVAGDLTIPKDAQQATFTVSILGNLTPEADKAFNVDLTNPVNADLGTSHATGTILNDDVTAGTGISVNDVKVLEGSSTDHNHADFVIRLDAAQDNPVTIHYTTVDGTAKAGTNDYTSTSGFITIPAHELTATVSVPVTGDNVAQADKTFSFQVDAPGGATATKTTGSGTILNDDSHLSISDVSLPEGTGSSKAGFVVTLDAAVNFDVHFHFTTVQDGTAVAGTDYTTVSGDYTIAAGHKSLTVNVPIAGDTVSGPNKTFSVALSDSTDPSKPTNALFTNTTATGTILNDDIAAANISADHTQFTYTDIDGDLVTVKSSKALFTSAAVVNSAFHFHASQTDPQQLQLEGIDFTALNPTLQVGSNLTFTVAKAGGGDGRVDVGYITSFTDLGSITIPGDLGKITVGDGSAKTPGIKLLDVQSIGAMGTSTGASDLISNFSGPVGTIHVRGDVVGALLNVEAVPNVVGSGSVASLQIDGALTGGSTSDTGEINASGNIVSATIGSILGGGGARSGAVISSTAIGSLHIQGSLTGGTANFSGEVYAPKIGQLTVDGNLAGGSGTSSGVISGKTISNLTIKGGIIGGAGNDSGEISETGDITSATIGSILGGSGTRSGSLISSTAINSLHVTGSVTGGTDADTSKATNSGEIKAPKLGVVTIDGGVVGGSGASSGLITANTISNLTISGGVEGRAGSNSGEIQFTQSLAKATIDHLQGGSGQNSGSIQGNYAFLASIGSINVLHSITGGDGQGSGGISTSTISNLLVGGDIHGGSGTASGVVQAGNNLVNGHVVGSVIGGDYVDNSHQAINSGGIYAGTISSLTIDKNIIGKTGINSGMVQALGTINSIKVHGSLMGGTAGTAAISADPEANPPVAAQAAQAGNSGEIKADILGTVTIDGSIIGGTNDGDSATGQVSGAVIAKTSLNSLTVGGSIQGKSGAFSGYVESPSINSLNIGGSLQGDDGDNSGKINVKTTIGKVQIGQNISGGKGINSGQIQAPGGIKSVVIGGNIQGSDGDQSGTITTYDSINPDLSGSISSVVVKGNITGGIGEASGSIAAGPLGTVTIGGNLVGAVGNHSGDVFSNSTINSVTIAGGITGAAGDFSGAVFTNEHRINSVKVGKDVQGGAGKYSGFINSDSLGSVTVLGAVKGDAGESSGSIHSDQTGISSLSLGSLEGGSGLGSGTVKGKGLSNAKIVGDVKGGGGVNSGQISIIGGDIKGLVLNNLRGGTANGSGAIITDGVLSGVTILNDVVGGNAAADQTLMGSGFIQARQIASLAVVGSVRAGNRDAAATGLVDSGTIRATEDILSFTAGNLVGTDTTNVIISAVGFVGQPSSVTTNVAIKSLTVKGNVSRTEILAGYGPVDVTNPDERGVALNGDAQISSVVVGGTWNASSLIAGVIAGDDINFGTADDTIIHSGVGGGYNNPDVLARITSVIIKGAATGSSSDLEHFGISADFIESAKINGVAVNLKQGFGNDTVSLASNFSLNEILMQISNPLT